MKKYGAKVKEEKIEVTLSNENDELMGVVYIDPADFNILRRAKEADEKINECMEKAEALSQKENKSDALLEQLEILDKGIRENINYIFNYDVCSVVFGNRHALSVSGGKYFFERLLEAFVPVFKDMAVEETKASQTRMAKYTGKYKK